MNAAGRSAWLGTRGIVIALTLVFVPAAAVQGARSKPKRGPVNATVSVDQRRAVSARITTAAGGTIVVKTANGTKITIAFPPGAVVEDTQVTAVPVKKFASRVTRTGLLAGVQLAPEGLQLHKPATARFTRRGKARKGTRLVFVGSEGTGRDVHRLIPPTRARGRGRKRRLVQTGAPVVSIWHFSTLEGFDWSQATVAEMDAVTRPSDGVAALSQEVSKIIANGGDVLEMVQAFERVGKSLIVPVLSKELAKGCSEASVRSAKSALTLAYRFQKEASITGSEEDLTALARVALLTKSAACLSSLCASSGDPRIGPYLVTLARQISILSGAGQAFIDALNENLARCSKFEVHLDSLINQNFEASHYSFRIDGRAKYAASGQAIAQALPRAPLTYVSTSGSAVSECTTTEISSTTNGEFEITDVKLGFYEPDKPTPPVLSLKLTVTVPPTETYHTRITPTVEGCGQEAPPDSTVSFWLAGFQAEHRGFTEFTFPGSDFVRDTPPKFVLAVYGPNTITLENGSVSENTLIELIHTPDPPLPLPEPWPKAEGSS